VVEEWDTEGLKVNSILPENKDAQTQGRDSFVGVNNNGFFIVDPREPRKVLFLRFVYFAFFSFSLSFPMVSSQSYAQVVRSHQYTNFKTTHFRCGASTKSGDLVVGTGLGEIRLFDQKAVAVCETILCATIILTSRNLAIQRRVRRRSWWAMATRSWPSM
jgi:hypothetical protein